MTPAIMSDEDKLKHYLQRNTPKKSLQKVAEVNGSTTPGKIKSPKTALAYYTRISIYNVLRFAGLLSFLSFILLLGFSDQKASVYILTAVAALFVIVLVLLFIRWLHYYRWINNHYFLLAGYCEFIAMRSADFWSKRMYTHVRVTVHLKTEATDLHREALSVYVKKCITQWNDRYKKIEWVTGYGKPKDFMGDSMSFHGDISRIELPRLISMLTSQFIPLAKVLGQHLLEIRIHSDLKEEEYKVTKRTRDAYDRQMGSSRGI